MRLPFRFLFYVLFLLGVESTATKSGPPPVTHFMGREIARTMHFSGAEWLIRETRENEEASSELLRLLGVEPGMTVCDLGCGNGYHTIPIAKLVGPEGKVYGVDIQPEMLEMLEERAQQAKLENIVPVLGELADPKLPEGEIDLVLLVDVYHEFSHPLEMMKAIYKCLKPEGRVALVEFREEDPKVPIKPLHKMSKKQILKEFPLGGFERVEEYDGLPWQHLMFFGKAAEGSNNGARFLNREMWVNDEDTAGPPNHVERMTFDEVLGDSKPEARSAESSLHSLRARPGFEVELVAAEPMVKDPIGLDWGPDGKLWVVEMADYPDGMDGEGEPGGRVRYLEDRDRDGVYECSTLYLDKIPFPTSVMAWRDGVLVTSAPDLFYAEDTDGDGEADYREVLYTGFGEGNKQHLVNGFRWGLDNWIYLANGGSEGDVKSLETGEVVSIKGRDLRIRPGEGLIEDLFGSTQFGRSRDDWGNWFGCDNPNPLWHFVLKDAYISRNPFIPSGNPKLDVSITPGPSTVFPRSRTLSRFNDPWAANRFTSACSAMIYRDDFLGEGFKGNSFVCEPVHNLVHREIVRPDGVTFTSRRAPDETESEFLASSDTFFRPTSVRTGPDGALWVVDMYRAQIEHTEYIPEELQEGVDFREGEEYGRIYRVYPTGGKPPQPIPILADLDTQGLVRTLDDPNGPLRDLAHRLIVERGGDTAIPHLENLFRTSERAEGRLHALCALDGLGGLDAGLALSAVNDAHPGVRRHGVRLSESFLGSEPSVGEKLLQWVEDPDPQVRLQVAYSLGEWEDPRAAEGLGRVALADGGDRFIRTAVLSSLNESNLGLTVETVLEGMTAHPPAPELIQNLVELAVVWKNHSAVASLVGAIASGESGAEIADRRFQALGGLLDALDRRGTTLADLASRSDEALQGAIAKLAPLFAAARAIATDSEAETNDRCEGLRLLGRGIEGKSEDLKTLEGLLSPQSPPALRKSAIAALGDLKDERIPPILVGAWKELTPDLCVSVLKNLIQQGEWISPLLDALESGAIHPREIDAAHRQRLSAHDDPEIRSRAKKIFEEAVSSNRAAVVEAYKEATTLAGAPMSGSATFKKLCSSCHVLGGVGRAFGPDLSALTDKSPQALLVHVLDPNRSVETHYLSYVVETSLGETHTGLLLRESANSIALVESDGEEIELLRENIETLRSSNLSFMPEGLEAGLVPRDFADLFAFVAWGQRPRKIVEGNDPRIATTEPFRGEIWLMASDCEMYGDTLTFEKTFANLGEWRSANDRAVWRLQATQDGPFVVVIDYACPPQSAGNRFTVEVAGQRFTGTVESTGSLDNYRRVSCGRLNLTAQTHSLALWPSGELEGELFDLRAVALQPAWMHGG